MPFLHGGTLEITLTVPLIFYFSRFHLQEITQMSNLEGYVNKENNQNIIYQSRALHSTFTDFSFFLVFNKGQQEGYDLTTIFCGISHDPRARSLHNNV